MLIKMLIKTIVLLLTLFLIKISCNSNINFDLHNQNYNYDDYLENDDNDYDETLHEFPINTAETFPNEKILNCQRINERLGDTCNCGYLDEVFTLPRFTDTNNYEINIINCKTLIIHNNTFLNLSFLKRIILTNIENLILEKDSFNVRRTTSRPSITRTSTLIDNLSTRLSLTNVIIEDLPSHSISGSFESIEFNNCKIGIIRSYAITGINNVIYNFTIKNTIINIIEHQSIKKISCNYFDIINTTFLNDLPSRCFYEIEIVNMLRINNNNLQRLHSSALFFQDVESFQLIENKFHQMNGESIRMSIKNTINIRDNDFGSISNLAFSGIKANPSFYQQNSENLIFNFIANNLELIDGLQQRIIVDNNFNINLQQLYYKKIVNCADISLITNPTNNNNFFLNYADTIYFKMENNNNNNENDDNIAENLTKNNNNNNNNNNMQVSTVKVLSNNNVYYALSYIINNKCIEETYLLYIIIGIVILIILIIIAIIIIICYVSKKRREKNKLNIIMPDGKTYRETQIIMQIENHGLLKTDL